MKRNNKTNEKKLSLNAEKIRTLDAPQLKQVAGGYLCHVPTSTWQCQTL